jgi:hypothetical protein
MNVVNDMKVRFIVIITGALFSCSKSNDRKSTNDTGNSLITSTVNLVAVEDTTHFDYADAYNLESYLTKSIEGENIETVDFDCAILIYPTGVQIEEMKKEGEEDFYIVADDNNWYQSIAIGVIDSVGIRKITANGRFLRLKGLRQTWNLDIRKKNLPPWNIVFFKTTKEPMVISIIDLTVDEVKNYFEIRE